MKNRGCCYGIDLPRALLDFSYLRLLRDVFLGWGWRDCRLSSVREIFKIHVSSACRNFLEASAITHLIAKLAMLRDCDARSASHLAVLLLRRKSFPPKKIFSRKKTSSNLKITAVIDNTLYKTHFLIQVAERSAQKQLIEGFDEESFILSGGRGVSLWRQPHERGNRGDR